MPCPVRRTVPPRAGALGPAPETAAPLPERNAPARSRAASTSPAGPRARVLALPAPKARNPAWRRRPPASRRPAGGAPHVSDRPSRVEA
ncbi:hypothetical protein GCM10018789_50580 [Streptomyces werraensis]|nr:hypothetical protein GCM10018789_50580 [Streptomyces werraensis]